MAGRPRIADKRRVRSIKLNDAETAELDELVALLSARSRNDAVVVAIRALRAKLRDEGELDEEDSERLALAERLLA